MVAGVEFGIFDPALMRRMIAAPPAAINRPHGVLLLRQH